MVSRFNECHLTSLGHKELNILPFLCSIMWTSLSVEFQHFFQSPSAYKIATLDVLPRWTLTSFPSPSWQYGEASSAEHSRSRSRHTWIPPHDYYRSNMSWIRKADKWSRNAHITTYRYSVANAINSWAPGGFWLNFIWLVFKQTSDTDGRGFSREIVLRCVSLDQTDDKSTLVQVMAWCYQATSHYLSQCWPRSMSSNGTTRL